MSKDKTVIQSLSHSDDFETLVDKIRLRLQGAHSIGPAIHRDEAPEVWLIEQYRRSDPILRERLTEVMRVLLTEITNAERWSEQTQISLLDWVQACGAGVVDDIHRLLRSERLKALDQDRAWLHAALLKCLISLGHKENPAFWVQQFEALGPQYGALIFSGLLQHGLTASVANLPELTKDEHALHQIALLIPSMVDEHGYNRVQWALEGVMDKLSQASGEHLTVMLNLLDPDGDDCDKSDHKRPLEVALRTPTGHSGGWGSASESNPERLKEMLVPIVA